MDNFSMTFQGFETQQVHAGQKVDSTTNARAVPIYASTSFVFKDTTHASEVFGLKINGYTYSRMSNPTVEVFEKRISALEGGQAAVAAATDQSAQSMAIMTLANSGDNIVVSNRAHHNSTYGYGSVFQQFGIDTKVIATGDPNDFATAIDSKTKAIYIEIISQADFTIAPIKELSQVAHKAKIPLIVDNTLGMAGYLTRPIEHGADIVVERITKWVDGHGVMVGGVVIDSGNFDWKQTDNYPTLTKPSTGHHSFVYADTFERTAFATKLRADILRDLGPTLEPFSAFFLLQGLETLSLRAERQCANAMMLARWLEKHVKVTSVSYLGLESHQSHELAKIYLREGQYGAVLAFALKGGNSTVDTVLRNLSLVSYLDAYGETKTLVFRQANGPQGNGENSYPRQEMIRVSLGIEAVEDIISDFAIALDSLN